MRPEQALIVHGLLAEAVYYRALARHLGLEFAPDPEAITVHETLQERWPQAISAGMAPLRGEAGEGLRWLLAPRGARIDELLTLNRSSRLQRERFVVSSPEVLRESVFNASARAIATRAAMELPDSAPQASAHGMRLRPGFGLVLTVLTLCGALYLMGGLWLAISLACGALLASAIVIRLFAAAASCDAHAHRPPVLRDSDLPVYTVIAAIYREAGVARQLTDALKALDYLASKLDIKIALEAGDDETLAALRELDLPARFEIIIVPDGKPRTKPRALNATLAVARGSLVCVFDAEDLPQPRQLRDAAEYFAFAPPDVACVQARLAIDNSHDGWLAAQFALEYAALFDVVNPGLAELRLPVPLGGTSNHFRTSILRACGGWDAWNVTEDIDLGLRLARHGYRTAVIGSSTGEEAPAELAMWMRQRRRWFKGWMQTLVVHARNPLAAIRTMGGLRAAACASHVAGTLLGAMMGPVFALLVAREAIHGNLLAPGSIMELVISTCWCFIFAAGALSAFWPLWLGSRRRRPGVSGRWMWTAPLYWLLQTIAAWWALIDLLRNPYHWHKTSHGLTANRHKQG